MHQLCSSEHFSRFICRLQLKECGRSESFLSLSGEVWAYLSLLAPFLQLFLLFLDFILVLGAVLLSLKLSFLLGWLRPMDWYPFRGRT